MRSYWRYGISGLILLALVIGSWASLSLSQEGALSFPGPAEALDRSIEMMFSGYRGSLLHEHLWASLSKVIFAVGAGVVTGVPLALFMSASPWGFGFTAPTIYFVRALPPLGYYSLLIVFFGIGDLSKIVLLYLAALPPIVISAYRATTGLPTGLMEAARILGSHGVHFFWHFFLPAISGGLFSGIRIATGFSLTTIVAAEIVAADSGIGWVILDASRYLQYDVVLVGVIAIGFAALVLDSFLSFLERRLTGARRKQVQSR